jgi:hypothetical protein
LANKNKSLQPGKLGLAASPFFRHTVYPSVSVQAQRRITPVFISVWSSLSWTFRTEALSFKECIYMDLKSGLLGTAVCVIIDIVILSLLYVTLLRLKIVVVPSLSMMEKW